MTRSSSYREGRWLANGLDRVTGLKKKLRGVTMPIVLGVPLGVTIETLPTHLPLPAKIRTELLDPIPAGLALFSVVTPDEAPVPQLWVLIALVPATAVAIAFLTSIPARLAARQQIAEALETQPA